MKRSRLVIIVLAVIAVLFTLVFTHYGVLRQFLNPYSCVTSENTTIDKLWDQLNTIAAAAGGNLEGNSCQFSGKITCVRAYLCQQKARAIMEIGFNAGHSAAVFLHTFPDATLRVYDICEHPYTEPCFLHLEREFPGRITMIRGDSTKTVPLDTSSYDLIHVDGGHDGSIPTIDLQNSYARLRPHGHIIFDDTWYYDAVLFNIGLWSCQQKFKRFLSTHRDLRVVQKCNGTTICFLSGEPPAGIEHSVRPTTNSAR